MMFLSVQNLGNEKNGPYSCLGYIGDCITQLGIIINHEIRIPIKQPLFDGKYPAVFFFSWLNLFWKPPLNESM